MTDLGLIIQLVLVVCIMVTAKSLVVSIRQLVEVIFSGTKGRIRRR